MRKVRRKRRPLLRPSRVGSVSAGDSTVSSRSVICFKMRRAICLERRDIITAWELANEPVEKVPTRKKRSESGVPKWFLDLRSSLKRQIRRPFYLQLLPSDFFYRLNVTF